jgi:hypothetical protein
VVCFPFIGHHPVGGSHVSVAKLIRHLDPERYRPLVVLHEMDGEVAALLRRASPLSRRRASGSWLAATWSPMPPS